MFERVVLVHYHEIGLKGHNRGSFESRLRRNLDSAVEGLAPAPAYRISSRLVVPASDGAARPEIARRVSRIPGVSYLGEAFVTARNPREVERAALLALREAGESETFRVEARRSNTDYPVSSNDTNIEVGRFLVERTGKCVDLGGPDVTVYVEVVQGSAYVYARRVGGPGGLPVGTSGKVVALLSAGIDSPVAAWRMMKRGAVVIAVHFSGEPHTGDLSVRLVREIVGALEAAEGLGRLYVVRFGDVQKEIALAAPPHLRVLLYRRVMLRIGEAIAGYEGARALVTGESLGQVASQTLENIAAIDAAATLPILRPLIGMDKNEIIAQARELGTYDISAQPHADCCTLFMPRTPATRASVAELDDAEAALDVGRMVAAALAEAAHEEYRCSAYRAPRAARRPADPPS